MAELWTRAPIMQVTQPTICNVLVLWVRILSCGYHLPNNYGVYDDGDTSNNVRQRAALPFMLLGLVDKVAQIYKFS